MDRKEALAELIAMVEAGSDDVPDFAAFVSRPLMQCKAGEAYRGSLDAAKALHDAVLPGWGWALTDIGEAHILSADGPIAAGESDNPARAWLLAILKSLHAQADTAQ